MCIRDRYYINRRSVRLKDVNELFMDTDVYKRQVVVMGSPSTAMFHQLTGGATNFNIQKGRQTITMSQIQPYDVVTYDSMSNTLIVSDLRLTCIYENASPNSKAPPEIEVLGHTFEVLDLSLIHIWRRQPPCLPEGGYGPAQGIRTEMWIRDRAWTVILLSPIFSKYSMFFLFCPWTTDTIMTTEATPIMMPSMVRKERPFFMAMDLKAILNARCV